MPKRVHTHTNLIYSVGTQVVALREVLAQNGRTLHPRGAVGVVVKAPTDADHAYRVRFADNVEETFHGPELVQLAEYKEGEIGDVAISAARGNLYERVIYRCVVGSRAYGLDNEASDTDRRGIYLPPAELQWSLYGVPEQLENDQTQEAYWELQKFIVLALKANPNVLECLYTPLVELATPLTEELLAMALVVSLADCLSNVQRLRDVAIQEDAIRFAQPRPDQTETCDALDSPAHLGHYRAARRLRPRACRRTSRPAAGHSPGRDALGRCQSLAVEFTRAVRSRAGRDQFARAARLRTGQRVSHSRPPCSNGRKATMNNSATLVLYRPIGQQEFDLISATDWQRFPPRLYWQPIFYPVLTEEYAIGIARDWNTKDPNSGYVGYVTKFHVRQDYINKYETHEVGGRDCVEYWIPSEDLESFNDAIVGRIEVIHEFRPDTK
jgi:hypothetical protein